MKVLEGLFYTKAHEWIKAEGGKAYIGISDHAQHTLGDIVFVDLPEVGTDLSAGDSFGAIESVKAASDIYCPVSGKILEVNDALNDKPELINEDAYESWIISVEMSDETEIKSLMTKEQYEEFCDEEA